MSALSDRIAEVLREHQLDWTDCLGCDWQQRKGAPDHAAHVAERIAELFTEERRTLDGYPRVIGDQVVQRRWVSAWSDVRQ